MLEQGRAIRQEYIAKARDAVAASQLEREQAAARLVELQANRTALRATVDAEEKIEKEERAQLESEAAAAAAAAAEAAAAAAAAAGSTSPHTGLDPFSLDDLAEILAEVATSHASGDGIKLMFALTRG